MPRPRTPTALKVVRGNPGKRPLPVGEPQPVRGPLLRPEHVRGRAAAEWERVVPELSRLGVATAVDAAVLEAYCLQYALVMNAFESAKPPTPAAIGQLRALMGELGLTPAARARIAVKAADGDETEARYFGAA